MSRKLQAEIERVFKKVAEGIEGFEDCYDKVLNASNAGQKEKYESDLKKEIKKLQRLRDQIKTWIQSNDIKDKQDLLHHRKLIEKQMEKFKAIEKEMKTKAYSKEGLLQSTKLDPKEKEKLDLCQWLVESVDLLTTQIDALEATAETIEGLMGKKRRDPTKVARLAQLSERVERHKFHIHCLERIQRLLENESMSTEQVLRIQEDVNYYVEENDNDEFVEDEFIYDELPLDDDDPLFAIPGEDDAFHDSESESETESAQPKPPQQRSPESEPVAAARTVLGKGAHVKHTPPAAAATTTPVAQPVSVAAVSVAASISVVPQPSTLPPAPIESKNAWAEVKESVLSPSRPATTTGTAQGLAQPWAAVASQNANATPHPVPAPAANGIKDALQSSVKPVKTPTTSGKQTDAASETAQSAKQPVQFMQAAAPQPVAPQPVSGKLSREGTVPKLESAAPPRGSTSPVGTKRGASEEQARTPMQRPKYFTLFQDDEVPDAFSDLMATFMHAKQQFSAKKAGMYSAQSQMMELSLQGIPGVLDQARPRPRGGLPQVSTPSYYPQVAAPVMEQTGMASRLDLDTLFFAFYYQPNTYQQFLAAKELNRQSWRFHKKYLTWFQRYEEPSDITDDYEQGTYIYFDYEGAWCQRKKADFRFEYQFLEDGELA
ncbi:general negative regulator of transcription subunit 5, partial [Coemansia sp. RSA 1752]